MPGGGWPNCSMTAASIVMAQSSGGSSKGDNSMEKTKTSNSRNVRRGRARGTHTGGQGIPLMGFSRSLIARGSLLLSCCGPRQNAQERRCIAAEPEFEARQPELRVRAGRAGLQDRLSGAGQPGRVMAATNLQLPGSLWCDLSGTGIGRRNAGEKIVGARWAAVCKIEFHCCRRPAILEDFTMVPLPGSALKEWWLGYPWRPLVGTRCFRNQVPATDCAR